jgi:D-tyrosyl-tRNA(Tyr) deacylase
VSADGEDDSRIGKGFLVLLGISRDDTEQDGDYITSKIAGLRIFTDSDDRMNLSLDDVGGEVLVVSQFTLYGDARKGRRPGYDMAAPGNRARPLYEYVLDKLAILLGTDRVKSGFFGASMSVELVNDGPVTILLDSLKGF